MDSQNLDLNAKFRGYRQLAKLFTACTQHMVTSCAIDVSTRQ